MRFPVLFILAFQCAQANRDIVPVFLLDYSNVLDHMTMEANPFLKLNASEFSDIVHDCIKRSDVVIIFVEDHFSVEDVSIKDKLGTPFHHLHQGIVDNKVKYFPAVYEPFKTITQIFQPHEFNVFRLMFGTKLQMFEGHFKYFYVYFEHSRNVSRAELLREHDLIMREVYFVVRQISSGAVIAFYTGMMNPVEIDKMEIGRTPPVSGNTNSGVMVVTDGALFRFVGVYASTQSRRAMFYEIPMVAEETWSKRSLSTKMAYADFELEFNFSFKDSEWLLDNAALLEGGEEVGRTEMGVGAPWNWSYYCSEPLVIVNRRDASSVTISEYQIQPLMRRSQHRRDIINDDVGDGDGQPPPEPEPEPEPGEGSADSGGFGKSVNCGPYFTSSILVGLMVTAICSGILAFGLIVMNDCHTNDRYDDPNGKPLVITPEGGH